MTQRLAVLTYADAENPNGIPGEWPCEVRPVGENAPVIFPWIAMTTAQYAAYVAEHQSLYDAWEYQFELSKMKAVKIEALWQSAYDYNFQFFSGGAYAQILELKLAGVTRALAAQGWILTLWGDYYQRKYAVDAALTHEALTDVNLDFSNHGNPPFTVPEMLQEAAQMGLM